jgi:UDP-N-acetylglucosamine 2-epimerase (non-hydrolysing)
MHPQKTILFVFGTRPEAVKFAPLILALKEDSSFSVKICITAQHREMLDQVLSFFAIQPDVDLNLMLPNQTLEQLTSKALLGLSEVLDNIKPDLVFVQGDTTTVLACALAAYYKKAKIAHLEAGLRSGDKYSPFPEEANRILTGHLADLHFAPTPQSVLNLRKENITDGIYEVGNTVIDALQLGLNIVSQNENHYNSAFSFLQEDAKIILVTCHRRESFGEPFEAICAALEEIATQNPSVQLVYPVHLNPNIKEVANKRLSHLQNIHLIAPLSYPELIWLMNRSYIVLTDSGGIQEEAPSLGKPVLVLRSVTERMEGVEAGTAKLVGTDQKTIVSETLELLNNKESYDRMSKAINPYGDGHSSKRIIEILKTVLNK